MTSPLTCTPPELMALCINMDNSSSHSDHSCRTKQKAAHKQNSIIQSNHFPTWRHGEVFFSPAIQKLYLLPDTYCKIVTSPHILLVHHWALKLGLVCDQRERENNIREKKTKNLSLLTFLELREKQILIFLKKKKGWVVQFFEQNNKNVMETILVNVLLYNYRQ